MRKNKDVINTAVASLVGGLCSRKQEVGGVIDSWLGVVECWGGGGEVELEGASWVLWLDGAADGEGGAPEHVKPLLLGLGDPVHRGGPRDVGLKQQVCKHREMIGWELGHVQSENSVHWFATVSGLKRRVSYKWWTTGFEVRFLSFGGCVRGVTQSAATCTNPAVL